MMGLRVQDHFFTTGFSGPAEACRAYVGRKKQHRELFTHIIEAKWVGLEADVHVMG